MATISGQLLTPLFWQDWSMHPLHGRDRFAQKGCCDWSQWYPGPSNRVFFHQTSPHLIKFVKKMMWDFFMQSWMTTIFQRIWTWNAFSAFIYFYMRFLNDSSIMTIREKKKCNKKIETLRNKGTFLANSKVLSPNKGTLFVRRCSLKHHCAFDYLPCTNCYAYFIVGELWRHNLQCTKEKRVTIIDDFNLPRNLNLICF